MSMLNTAELCLRKGKDSKFHAMHVFSQFVKKKKKKESRPGITLSERGQTRF